MDVLDNPIWTSNDIDEVFQNNRDYQLANVYRMKGNLESANRHFDLIIDRKERVMNSSLQVQVYGGMTVARALAHRGRFEEALELANLIYQENPREKDEMLYGWLLSTRAMIKALAGDEESAIDDLALALKTPAAFQWTPWELHLDPNWDFLRDNPRFVELATPPTVIRTMKP